MKLQLSNVSEHHYLLNVSTTTSVVPESSIGAHVNVSWVIQYLRISRWSVVSSWKPYWSGLQLSWSGVWACSTISLCCRSWTRNTGSLSDASASPTLELSTHWSVFTTFTDEYHTCRDKTTSQLSPGMWWSVDVSRCQTAQECSALSVPPPLVSNLHSKNVNPFNFKNLAGNIHVCEGCRGSLRSADGIAPSPPFAVPYLAWSSGCWSTPRSSGTTASSVAQWQILSMIIDNWHLLSTINLLASTICSLNHRY